MYAERPSALAGAVVWHRISTGDEVRVLPDACMDLLWTDDGRLVIAGPDTRPQLYRAAAGVSLTGLRFAPGTAPLALGVPAHAVRDLRVPLTDLWPPTEVGRLAEDVAATPDPGAALERAAAIRLRSAVGELAMLEAIVRLLGRGARIPQVAEALGLSERQLHRRSLDAFGYGPKMLAGILRLTRAVERARMGVALVDAADGFADQAHLAREARRLAGVPLTTLTR